MWNGFENTFYTSIVNIGAQHLPCGGGQVAKDPVPGQLCYVPVEAIEVDPAAVKGNCTTSSVNYEQGCYPGFGVKKYKI